MANSALNLGSNGCKQHLRQEIYIREIMQETCFVMHEKISSCLSRVAVLVRLGATEDESWQEWLWFVVTLRCCEAVMISCDHFDKNCSKNQKQTTAR